MCCAVLSRSVVSYSLHPMDCSPPGTSVHGDSPEEYTGVGCHALFQGIFPTQVLNLGLPHCNPLQYSCLENPLDRGAWCAVVHGVTKSWTQLRDSTLTFYFHALEKEMVTHSSVLAWRIPGTGEPGGLLSMGSHRVGYEWSDLAAAAPTLQADSWLPEPPGKRPPQHTYVCIYIHIIDVYIYIYLSEG